MSDDSSYIQKLIANLGRDGYKDGSSSTPGVPYHPVPGVPVPVSTTACHDELTYIMDDLMREPTTEHTLFEIGCAVGYFSFHFADIGWSVTALEADRAAFMVCDELRAQRHQSLWFRNEAFDDDTEIAASAVGLCLNVHMWVEKQIGPVRTAAAMTRFFERCGRSYFQTAHAGAQGKYKSYLRNETEVRAFLEFTSRKPVQKLADITGHGGVRYLFRVG